MKASVVASMANSWRVEPLIVSTKYANTVLVPHNGFAILDAHVHHGVVLRNRSLECRCTRGVGEPDFQNPPARTLLESGSRVRQSAHRHDQFHGQFRIAAR